MIALVTLLSSMLTSLYRALLSSSTTAKNSPISAWQVFKHSFEMILNSSAGMHLQVSPVPSRLWFAAYFPIEFTEHQRNVFCVFSGQGVTGLRNHLNRLEPTGGYDDPMTGADDDDDQTMTGMVGATAMMGMNPLNGDDEDADEELEDGDGGGDGGVSFHQTWNHRLKKAQIGAEDVESTWPYMGHTAGLN
jgi:hypothetical protein